MNEPHIEKEVKEPEGSLEPVIGTLLEEIRAQEEGEVLSEIEEIGSS
jgi:hypothetical protein